MMKKTVFLFPGQGSQEVGMGHDLFRQDAFFLKLIDYACQWTGADLKKICLKGPDRQLNQSRIVQPLLVTISLGYWRVLQEQGVKADFILGHSLGEITGLAAAGVIDCATAVTIACKRGELMDAAAAQCDGSMWACLNIDAPTVMDLLASTQLQEKLVIANVNTPIQVVASGDKSAFEILAPEITKRDGRVKKLNVAGPWHSPYLQAARQQFQDWLAPITFQPASTPLILNHAATVTTNPEIIKDAVSTSLTDSVEFTKCMDVCREQGVDTFIEIGPGRVLSGLVRANGFDAASQIYLANNLRGTQRVLEMLGQG